MQAAKKIEEMMERSKETDTGEQREVNSRSGLFLGEIPPSLGALCLANPTPLPLGLFALMLKLSRLVFSGAYWLSVEQYFHGYIHLTERVMGLV